MSVQGKGHDGWSELQLAVPVPAVELREALEALAGDPRQRVALLTGDLSAITGWSGEASRWLWRDLALPVACAFDGALAGDAAHVAFACDVRVGGPAAAITIPAGDTHQQHRLAQLTPGTTTLVPGERMGSDDLLSQGLVSAVAPDPLAEAERLCTVIASRGPIATRLAKEALWRGLDMPLEQGLRFETDLTLLLQTTKDRAEGVRAFLEKRAPQFEGD